ncbi:MAG: thermonuclease family protein [Sneathiellaceae bacterium]
MHLFVAIGFWGFLAFCAAPMPEAGETIIGRASVIDGDTLEIRRERIRLHGIDAPEAAQHCQDAAGDSSPCGRRAALALAARIGAANVECLPTDQDRYGRTVAVCWLAGEDLNAWMVESGWAMAYRRYSLDYVPQEEAAKTAKRGMWRGRFVEPWRYRAGDRQ